MTGKYASNTTVSTEKSKNEIERTLSKYGADAFFYKVEGAQAEIGFRFKTFRFRLEIIMPDRSEFNLTPTGMERWEDVAQKAWETACKQRWRAMAGYIKMTLEAVEVGIIDLQTALMPHIIMPDNTTLGQWILPEIEQAYLTGNMPKMLPSGKNA